MLKIRLTLLMFFLAGSSLHLCASADPKDKKRYNLSLNNSLLPSANSPTGMRVFSQEILQLSAYPINSLNEKYAQQHPYTIIALTLASGALLYLPFPIYGVSSAHHEFGHARGLRLANPKSNPEYYSFDKIRYENSNPFTRVYIGSNYYHMLANAFTNWGAFVLPLKAKALINSYYNNSIKTHEFLSSVQNLIDSPEIDTIQVFAGGLNNNALIASSIEEQNIIKNQSHLFDILSLSHNKLMPKFYPYGSIPQKLTAEELLLKNNHICLERIMNDHGSIERHYRKHCIIPNYDYKSSHAGCFISYFLSGSTYQSFYNIYNYIITKNVWSTPLSYKGLYLPNTNFFFTSKGLSLKFNQAYRYSENLLFNLSYETVYEGIPTKEIGFSARYTVPQLYDLSVTSGVTASFTSYSWVGGQIHIKASLPVNQYVHIEAAYYLWNSHTLDGERNMTVSNKSHIDHEVMIGCSMFF